MGNRSQKFLLRLSVDTECNVLLDLLHQIHGVDGFRHCRKEEDPAGKEDACHRQKTVLSGNLKDSADCQHSHGIDGHPQFPEKLLVLQTDHCHRDAAVYCRKVHGNIHQCIHLPEVCYAGKQQDEDHGIIQKCTDAEDLR